MPASEKGVTGSGLFMVAIVAHVRGVLLDTVYDDSSAKDVMFFSALCTLKKIVDVRPVQAYVGD
jgi:chromosome condensin MukBEF ATPase and DNA-binding subunit MukB